jgi:type 1 glutamine amidotransferase
VLAADDPEARFRVLVFSKTAGFRHSSIDEGIAAIKKLGADHGFQVDATEDPSVFRDGVLSHFDTVVFLSTTGDVLNLSQQAAFERYIAAGGGYTGVHAASDTEYDWRWYGNLVGAYFRNHPANQDAFVDVEDQEHPSTEGLPDRYERYDEWYNFKSPAFAEVGDADFSPRARVHVLATVDESTYNEDDGNATDDDHPVTWCQRYDGGRSWYTAMGHTEESFTEANFLQQLLGGIETTAGAKPSAECGIAADVTAPTSKVTLDPASPANTPIKVTLEATDDAGGSGVATLEYKVDGAAEWTTYTAPFTVSAEGKHTVAYRATDEAGNVEDAKTVSVEVDVTAPTTTATLNPAKPHKSGVYKQAVQVTLAAGDGAGSGVARTEYRINGGAWLTYAAPFTVTADGQHTVEYRSVDEAGNTEATKSTSFRIKKPGNFGPGT